MEVKTQRRAQVCEWVITRESKPLCSVSGLVISAQRRKKCEWVWVNLGGLSWRRLQGWVAKRRSCLFGGGWVAGVVGFIQCALVAGHRSDCRRLISSEWYHLEADFLEADLPGLNSFWGSWVAGSRLYFFLVSLWVEKLRFSR